jgi:hypothetical protein
VRSKYPEKSLSDNRTKPIWEDGSETALYRGSGRLFKPRPGPTRHQMKPLPLPSNRVGSVRFRTI